MAIPFAKALILLMLAALDVAREVIDRRAAML